MWTSVYLDRVCKNLHTLALYPVSFDVDISLGTRKSMSPLNRFGYADSQLSLHKNRHQLMIPIMDCEVGYFLVSCEYCTVNSRRTGVPGQISEGIYCA